MLQKHIIRAIGGLNRDDDSRYLPENDYIEMLNMRTGANQSQGDRGLAETFISNYEIKFSDVEEEVFTPIAIAVDEQQDIAIILAYQNGSTPYFQIYKFTILTDTVIKIFETKAEDWGITTSTKVYNPRILDGKIIWTDNANPIFYIDLSRLETSFLNGIGIDTNSIPTLFNATIEYSEGDMVYYEDSIYVKLSKPTPTPPPPMEETPDMSDEWEYICKILECYMDISSKKNFTLSANPPTMALTPSYFNNQNRVSNNLRNKTFQFTYRYVYIDYRKSTYAPPSIVAAPSQEENIDGTQNTDQKYHNTIILSINTGNEEIRNIEIIGRSSEDPASWFYVGEISLFDKDGRRNIPSNTEYGFYFYNDLIRQIIDPKEVYTLFTYVPVKAKHMELIEGNRLVFANITEGYDRIQQDVTTELTYETITSGKGNTFWYALDVSPVHVGGNVWRLKLSLPEAPKHGTYNIVIEDEFGNEYTAEYEYLGGGDYPLTVKEGLINSITTNGWDSELISYGEGDGAILFFERSFSEYETPYYLWDYQKHSFIYGSDPAVNKVPVLKSGQTHNWGIVYRDRAGIMSPIIGAGEIKEEIPFPTQTGGGDITTKPVIKFNINHSPPEWAVSYEIIYLGNDSYFLQLLGYMLSIGRKNEERDDPDGDLDERFGRISVDFISNRTRDKIPNWAVEQYIFEEGDRIRFIGYTQTDNIITRYIILYDVPIHGIFTDTVYVNPNFPGDGTIDMDFIYFQRVLGFPSTSPVIADSYLVEIYRPQKEVNINLFYTTGMTFPIKTDLHGNKYHTGDMDDQILNETGKSISPAIVTNTAHNAWKYLRNFQHQTLDQALYLYCESQYASDYYLTNKLTSIGIPIPQLDNYRQTELTKRIRHGGKYNYGTELNQLAKFDYDDFKDMKDEFGDIEGVRELGFVLKVIQYIKITSIYLSRIESYSGNEESQFLFTDKVFGSLRPGLEDFGTRHPDSICVYNNNLYFWDQSEGAVVRDAINGQIPISMYKMISFFRDKAKEMDNVLFDNQEVYFGYNMMDNMLFCTFGDGSIFETVVFSEAENRWKYTTDATIRKWFWLGRRLFHIHNGNIYEWWRDEGQGYLKLSGVQKEGKITVIGNGDPLKSKTFNAIAVYQDGDTPQAEIIVPKKGSAVSNEMKSIVAAWEKREGIYYGKILRDVNTPGMTGVNNLYMNGRKLRGQYCEITLSFNKINDKVKLFNTMLTTTSSERSL